MKRLALALTLAFGFSQVASADFQWLVGGTDRITDHLGADAMGSKTDPAAGFFVELVYAGGDNTINTPGMNFNLDTTGTGGDAIAALDLADGDDVVVAWAHVGQGGTFFSPANGVVNGGVLADDAVEIDGGLYYLRVWEAPSPNFAGGVAPLPSTGDMYFGISEGLINPGGGGGDTPPGIPPDPMGFGGFQTANVVTVGGAVIPEPTTFGLLGLGFLGMVVARRKRRA